MDILGACVECAWGGVYNGVEDGSVVGKMLRCGREEEDVSGGAWCGAAQGLSIGGAHGLS